MGTKSLSYYEMPVTTPYSVRRIQDGCRQVYVAVRPGRKVLNLPRNTLTDMFTPLPWRQRHIHCGEQLNFQTLLFYPFQVEWQMYVPAAVKLHKQLCPQSIFTRLPWLSQ
jgi:hypothetical protein